MSPPALTEGAAGDVSAATVARRAVAVETALLPSSGSAVSVLSTFTAPMPAGGWMPLHGCEGADAES